MGASGTGCYHEFHTLRRETTISHSVNPSFCRTHANYVGVSEVGSRAIGGLEEFGP